MIFPWFSVLADAPGFYTTLFPDLESWQETQEPFNLREQFGDFIKDDAPGSTGSWYKRSRFSVLP
ncbi:MAG: hypothetical protein MR654_02445 [Corynebacterium glucuronolyticum]|nr:hypothetical protein [Corynebacterium glucuronolyticum]